VSHIACCYVFTQDAFREYVAMRTRNLKGPKCLTSEWSTDDRMSFRFVPSQYEYKAQGGTKTPVMAACVTPLSAEFSNLTHGLQFLSRYVLLY